ncbi:substrate-binding domain-containing protein [Paenibacillus agricola]|uniref:Helix-turn-helix transcriptional regulator n=1 Tax=Paenibacillus agricola TaxID=2716264 RepID=A0ABX0J3P5_9BACL|nr:helix-turn-helix transcriptional regulator [Paenibacillus agricola]NHN30441.1 helix-turn-helix transcriptional regulator [Paenibacillus agricola]
MSDISYTTEEIGKLLKVSKVTVYDLIKKGDLPSFRVGKQMRVDAADLEAYKNREKASPFKLPSDFQERSQPVPAAPFASNSTGNPTIVITGQDISIDILARQMEKHIVGARPLRAYMGSLDGLIALYRGECDMVSTHLFDGETGTYNLPYISRIFIGSPFLVVNLLTRHTGFFVAKGNPLKLRGWSDLKKPGLSIVNREKGVGSRVLLDEQLRLLGMKAELLKGYGTEESNPIAVAAKVASGEADVGIGNEKSATMIDGVDFIRLIEERVDLVMLKKPENHEWIQAVVEILNDETFRAQLRAIPGYDLSKTGQIMLET